MYFDLTWFGHNFCVYLNTGYAFAFHNTFLPPVYTLRSLTFTILHTTPFHIPQYTTVLPLALRLTTGPVVSHTTGRIYHSPPTGRYVALFCGRYSTVGLTYSLHSGDGWFVLT